MASSVAIKNIKSIHSVGDLPYASVYHILVKVEDARQLRRIELNCPQLQSETGELWLKLIEKDFPLELKANGYKPKSQDKWYKVWEKYKAEHDRSLQESEEKLRAALMGLQENKEKNVSKIVEGRFLPQDAVRHKKRNTGPKDNTTSVLSFGGGSRTKTITPAGVMRKARREAKEVRNIHGSLSRSIVTPIRVLEKQHLKAPPPAMVAERRIAAQPAFRTPEAEKSEQRIREMEEKRDAALWEHDQRAAYITDSEDDSEEFGHLLKPTKKLAAPAPAPAASQTKPVTPARKLPGSGGSMFQRKFAPGKGPKASPPKPLRTATTTATTAASTGKKRTSSEANLDHGSSASSKRPATEKQPSYLHMEPSPQRETAQSQSPTASSPEQTPKMVARKKKPVSIFMKRPVKRN